MDASLPEFLLLFVIGLLVLGPERMAQVAKKIGHFVGYARRMSRNFQVQLEDELEMKQIRDSLPTRVDLRKELGLDEIEKDVRKIGDEISGHSREPNTNPPAKTGSAELPSPDDVAAADEAGADIDAPDEGADSPRTETKPRANSGS